MSVQLAVIGGGNMARAIVEGAIRGGVLQSSQVAVADPDDTCRSFFDQLGCVTVQCAIDLPKTKYTLIAVKPQVFDEVASCITSEIIYSIMAGVSTSRISQAIGNECVIRVMPNLPCSVGYGAAGLALGSGATAEDAQLAIELFSAVGSVVDVDEPLMDAVTAVSGSGPAYVFLLAEAMIAGGIQTGLDPEIATELVQQTIRGAAELLVQDDRSATALREAVTSKGGTTDAATTVMQDRGFSDIVVDAVVAACNRGKELGES